MYRWTLSFVLIAFAAVSVAPQGRVDGTASGSGIPRPVRAPADPNKFGVIIIGASGEPAYAKQFSDWYRSLRSSLVENLGFSEDRLYVLTETPASKTETRASAEEVRAAFEKVQRLANQDSSLFVFLIGHGSFDGKQSKFNLVGPDLHAGDYKDLFAPIAARRTVIINMSSASGEFAKSLAGRGRIVVTATRSGQEQNAPRFPEHFIKALVERESDADQNGRVSVLEAFEYAVRLVTEHYKRTGRLATEHALLEDNGDGVGHEKSDGGDGSLARSTYFDSFTTEQAAANAEVMRLVRDRTRYEDEIEQVKGRKSQLPESEYWDKLEKLFIELAKTNRGIKRASQ